MEKDIYGLLKVEVHLKLLLEGKRGNRRKRGKGEKKGVQARGDGYPRLGQFLRGGVGGGGGGGEAGGGVSVGFGLRVRRGEGAV